MEKSISSSSTVKGTMFYLMGPSGVGKDTLLNYLRQRCPSEILIAHRYITRPIGNSPEEHIPVTEDEFQARKESGFFSFTWQAHGFWYGVSYEVEQRLNQGRHVVINGSREAYARAWERFPSCRGILIQADPYLVQARLTARGRENKVQLVKRLERSNALKFRNKKVITLNNNSSPEQGGFQLLKAIQEVINEKACKDSKQL